MFKKLITSDLRSEIDNSFHLFRKKVLSFSGRLPIFSTIAEYCLFGNFKGSKMRRYKVAFFMSEGIPSDIKKATLYLRIFEPLKLPNKQYSAIVEKMGNLPEKDRTFFLNRWKELSISDRKSEVINFLNT